MSAPYIQTFEAVFFIPATAQNEPKPIFQLFSSTDADGGSMNGVKLDPRILEIEVQLLSSAACELYVQLTRNTNKGTPTIWRVFPNCPKIGGIYHTVTPRFSNGSQCPVASVNAKSVSGLGAAILETYTVNPSRGDVVLRRLSLPAGIGNSQIFCWPDEGQNTTGFFSPVFENPTVPEVEFGPGVQIYSGVGNIVTLNPDLMMRVRWQEVPRTPLGTPA